MRNPYGLPINGRHFFLLPQSWWSDEPGDLGGFGYFVRFWLQIIDTFVAIVVPLLVVIFGVSAIARALS